MTFFYDLNKKLDSIREKPETTHGQLNERDEGKPGKNFEKIAKSAGERYGSKAAGERVAGAVRNKLKAQGKLEEAGMDESAFQAAIGKKKYGEEGMKALQKAGRDGASSKTMSNIRNKYDKYDEGIEDRIGDLDQSNPVNQPAYQRKSSDYQEPTSRFDYRQMDKKIETPAYQRKALGAKPLKLGDVTHSTAKEDAAMTPKQKSFAKLAPPTDKITFADKIAGAKKEVDEVLGDVAAEAIKGALSPKQKKIDMNKNGKLDANDFAMLRKGAKGKEETDEGWDDMLKDVERRRGGAKVGDKWQSATGKGEVTKTATGVIHTRKYDPKTGETDTGDDAPATGEKRGRGRPKKAGGPSQERVTAKSRKADRTTWQKKTNEGENESDDVKQAMAVLKKAGYKVTKAADGAEELDEKAVSKKQQRFMGMVHATQKGEKAPSKEVAKVAKSMKKSDAEDFASTKHKGLPEKKKPESKKKEKTEEAGGTGTPTASSGFSFGKGIYDSMNRDLESMIAESMARLDESMNVSMNMNTDSQGGPSKSLTVTATDDDALKLGTLLKNAGLGDGSEPGGSDSVADEIRSAIAGNDEHDHGEEPCPDCGSTDCGCDGEEVDEAYGDNAVSDNEPDWPTNQETAANNFGYAGGLNKPKASGMATMPVTDVQVDGEDNFSKPARMNEEDTVESADYEKAIPQGMDDKYVKFKCPSCGTATNAGLMRGNNYVCPNCEKPLPAKNQMPLGEAGDAELARIKEMAGIKEGKKPDFLDVDKDGDKKEPFKKAVDDKKEKKVDEGILSATANLWKEYKAQAGV